MKLVYKNLEKDGKGSISLVAQEDEDMWHVYNLVQEGDKIRALTFRNVKTTGPTGSVKSEKVKVVVTVEVSSVDFDTKSSEIRISGRNIEENKYIKMGAHHTLELALHRKFTIIKDCWDAMHLERIEMATDPSKTADLAAIVLQEGLAHVCLITSYTTLIRQKISSTVPRKRPGSETRHSRALERFYEGIYEAVERHIDFEIVKCVIVASPGFFKDECIKRIHAIASKRGNKQIMENKSKFLPRHASSGHMQALREVLADPSCSELIKTTKAFDEVKALERFFEMMNKNPDQAFYGYDDVLKANEAKAIHELLVTDSLFRSKDIQTRRKYVKLVESARENGADVKVFSSLHVSGQQLDQLTGVAALLRFPYILEAEEPEQVKPERKSGTKKKKKPKKEEDDFDGSFLGDF
uniref:Protein pelota homolog n=2 Tax=Lotharella globosa TaxID=91324 RepID=A0A6U2Y014_9EUKA|mmetsp:Transcript_14766/g.29930  ORF Transcript_14766/g.29930 Transcript_14766/m.29930 type:complete len:410 (+) Transcript_14766:57-1286(+)